MKNKYWIEALKCAGLGEGRGVGATVRRRAVSKLTSVFYACVLLLIIVKVAENYYVDNVMTKFIVNSRTDALTTNINLLFPILNCQIARSRLLTRRKNNEFMCLSAY